MRLRKKAKKDLRGSGVSSAATSGGSGNTPQILIDPSVQRLIDQSTRDLNNHYRQLCDHEKKCLRHVIMEERHRYCNLVASLKPIIDEEMGMLSELASVEDIMQKLGSVATNPEEIITDQFIDDAALSGGGSGAPLVYATPPATPSPSMGSRKSSMCSIASIASSSTTTNGPVISPSRSSTTSSLRRNTSFRVSFDNAGDSRPGSALSASVSLLMHFFDTRGTMFRQMI